MLKDHGVVVQLVRISACHAEGRGFESRPLRQLSKITMTFFAIIVFLYLFVLNIPFLLPFSPCKLLKLTSFSTYYLYLVI